MVISSKINFLSLRSWIKLVYFGMMVDAALMPYVPDRISVTTVSFVILFSLLVFLDVTNSFLQGKITIHKSDIFLLIFLLSVLLSLPVAKMNDVTLYLWFRGAVPFLFLSTYFLIPKGTIEDSIFIIKVLKWASVAWLIKILFLTGYGIVQIVLGKVTLRLTYYTLDLTMPYSFIGFILFLFSLSSNKKVFNILFTIMFFLVALLTAYRSLFFILLLILLLYIVIYKKYISGFFILLIFFFLFVKTPIIDIFKVRLETFEVESENARVREIMYALKNFLDSPLLGKGLGFKVPIDVTLGEEAIFATRNFVGYIHNLAAYLLMDLGLIGFFSYFIFVCISSIKYILERKYLIVNNRKSLDTVVISIFAILMFFLVQASFRQVQSNLILASLIAALSIDFRQVKMTSKN